MPEPWATRLVQEGGGKVLVDERDLWPDGKYVTTHVMVATKFLKDHPDVVKQFLEGQVAANDWVNQNGAEAQTVANDEIGKITGKPLKPEVIAAAWPNLTFTDDPIASSLITSAKDAVDVGLLKPVDNLQGIYDLTLLNQVLSEADQPEVSEHECHHARTEGLQRRGWRHPCGPQLRQQAVRERGQRRPRPRPHLAPGPHRGVRLPGRRVRLRQDHAAQPGRRARPRHVRRGRAERQGRPDVPGGRAVPLAVGGQERRAGAAAAGRAPQPAPAPRARAAASSSGSRASSTSSPTSCRAACASASPWPGRWRRRPTSSSWTSPSAPSTP